MRTNSTIIASAIAAAIALSSTASAQEVKVQRCYGIAKAGMNDCQTATTSCANTAKKDGEKHAFILVPVGTCAKIVGASIAPGK